MSYIEVCGGGASVLLNKQPSVHETYNDIDPQLSNIFYQLVKSSDEMLEAIVAAQYSNPTFDAALKANRECQLEDRKLTVQDAVNELLVRRMSRGGLKLAFSWSERLRGGRPGDLNAFETFKAELPRMIERMKNVHVTCMPAVELIKHVDTPNCFYYIDPPYLPSTRRATKAYTCEMTEADHVELGETLKDVKGKVLLSGYPSPLYLKLFKGWNFETRTVANHSGQNKTKERRIECIWRNY